MGYFNQLSQDIQTRLMNGDTPESIAQALEVPIDWVYSEIEVQCTQDQETVISEWVDERMYR